MKAVKTAVIGCGAISSAYMKNLKERFSIIELAACSDLDVEKMNSRADEFDIKPLTFQEILADPEMEMIINLTNPMVHYEITKTALLAGKHVYSEKMLAVTTKQAKELCQIANEKKLYLGVAPDTFLGGTIQTARYLLEHGMIGKPLSFVASLTRDFGIFAEILPHLRKPGGSITVDTGCYYMTALTSLLGNVDKVNAFSTVNEQLRTGRRLGTSDFGKTYEVQVENILCANVLFKNGVMGTFHMNSDCIFDETRILRIYGTEGILSIDDPNHFGSKLTLRKPFGPEIEFPLTHGFTDEYRGIGAAEMAWSMRKGRKNRASAEMGYHVLEVLEGMAVSAQTGKLCQVESEFEQPSMLPAGFIGGKEYGMWAPTEETALS